MTKQTFLTILAMAAMAVSGLRSAAGQPTNLADPRPSPVTAVELSAGTLIIKAAGKSHELDGTYKNSRGGQWIEFKAGEPIAVSVGRRKQAVRETIVHRDSKVAFLTGAGEVFLDDGSFVAQRPGQPEGTDPQPQPPPQLAPSAFEIDDGKIESVWIQ